MNFQLHKYGRLLHSIQLRCHITLSSYPYCTHRCSTVALCTTHPTPLPSKCNNTYQTVDLMEPTDKWQQKGTRRLPRTISNQILPLSLPSYFESCLFSVLLIISFNLSPILHSSPSLPLPSWVISTTIRHFFVFYLIASYSTSMSLWLLFCFLLSTFLLQVPSLPLYNITTGQNWHSSLTVRKPVRRSIRPSVRSPCTLWTSL